MKKKLMFVAAIATMGLGAFLTACEDESCVCEFVLGSYSYTEAQMPSEYGVATCGQVEDALNDANALSGDVFDSIVCR